MLIGGKTIQHYLCKYRSKGGAPAPGTIVVLDEMSEVQLHTWTELARWKLVGVLFICIGDMRGQRLPMFDKWNDAMNKKSILHSQFLWEMCGGVRVDMVTNRRGDDPALFKRYWDLYPHADDPSMLHETVQRGLAWYPLRDNIDVYFVISHEKRIVLNRAMNYAAAAKHDKVLYLPEVHVPDATTMPQAMIIWEGLELICSRRRYESNCPVTGAVYVVKSWNDTTVTMTLQKDYVAAGQEPPEFILSHTKTCEIMRLQFAICIAAIQGRTFRNTHVGLLDLHNPHLTMRDLITAMSRPTNGRYLHFVTPPEQAMVMRLARGISDEDLRRRGQA
jgi:hypothetical protein